MKHTSSMDFFCDVLPRYGSKQLAREKIYDHLTFHELGQFSQTNKIINETVATYFNNKKKIIQYFKSLHCLTVDIFQINSLAILELAKIGVSYQPMDQYWILNYAIKYITNHFPMPYKEKTVSDEKINVRFNEWIYIIRTFQASDKNFDADVFVDKALTNHVLSYKTSIYKVVDAIEKNRYKLHAMSPNKIIQNSQISRFNGLIDQKERIMDNTNNFNFLFLFYSGQQIFQTCQLQLHGPIQLDGYEMLERCINILYMRGAKGSLMNLIEVLNKKKLSLKEEVRNEWVQTAHLFLRIHNSWVPPDSIIDTDMAQKMEKIKEAIDSERNAIKEPTSPYTKTLLKRDKNQRAKSY